MRPPTASTPKILPSASCPACLRTASAETPRENPGAHSGPAAEPRARLRTASPDVGGMQKRAIYSYCYMQDHQSSRLSKWSNRNRAENAGRCHRHPQLLGPRTSDDREGHLGTRWTLIVKPVAREYHGSLHDQASLKSLFLRHVFVATITHRFQLDSEVRL